VSDPANRIPGGDGQRSRAAYESWHVGVESDSVLPDLTPWQRLLFRYLRPEDVSGRRVLEIGCGRGELARRIVSWQAPAVYVATDFARSAVTLARRRCSDCAAARWAVADAHELPLASAAFDTVICCEVVEHLPDPAKAIRDMHRVLRPGGRLLLTTPNYLSATGAYRGYMRLTGRRFTEEGQPINRFTMWPRTMWWLYRAGFSGVRCDAIGHYRLRPGRVPTARVLSPSIERLAWPSGLHSLFVAGKR
jgi:SAM-dependent methyltransferase